MKSMINDFEMLCMSNPDREIPENLIDDQSVGHAVTNEWTNIHQTMAQRAKTRLRRRGDTTMFDGPVGARPLGRIGPMVGAWATAAFGRGDNRKVFYNIIIN